VSSLHFCGDLATYRIALTWQMACSSSVCHPHPGLTGMCRIVYQVNYRHKPSVFSGLQNDARVQGLRGVVLL